MKKDTYIGVIVFIRIFFRPHKEHVLKIMGETIGLIRILKRANPHTESSRRFLGFRIRNNQDLKFVLECESMVDSGVTDTTYNICGHSKKKIIIK